MEHGPDPSPPSQLPPPPDKEEKARVPARSPQPSSLDLHMDQEKRAACLIVEGFLVPRNDDFQLKLVIT